MYKAMHGSRQVSDNAAELSSLEMDNDKVANTVVSRPLRLPSFSLPVYKESHHFKQISNKKLCYMYDFTGSKQLYNS